MLKVPQRTGTFQRRLIQPSEITILLGKQVSDDPYYTYGIMPHLRFMCLLQLQSTHTVLEDFQHKGGIKVKLIHTLSCNQTTRGCWMIPSALVLDVIIWPHFLLVTFSWAAQCSHIIIQASSTQSHTNVSECMCMSLKGDKGWGKLKAFKYYWLRKRENNI